MTVTAIEGGTNHWIGIDNTTKEWKDKPKGVPVSEWITHLLLNEKNVVFFDVEDFDEKWVMTKEKLIKGINTEFSKNPINDMSEIDADIADNIFQYALFDKIIFG